MHAPHAFKPRSRHELNVRLLRFHATTESEEPVMLARDLLAAGMPDDALDVVDAAIDRDPDDADLMLTLGITLLVSGELAWAKRVLTKAVMTDPDWAEPWRWLGDALVRSTDFERAARVLARARALGDDDPAVGTLLAMARRTEILLSRVERFLADRSVEEPSLFARELIAAERLEDARCVLGAALAEDQDDPDLLVACAELEQASGDFDAAKRSLVRATRADPGWESAWNDLEALLRKAGDDRAANAVAEAARVEREARAEKARAAGEARAAAKRRADDEAREKARADVEARAKKKVEAEVARAKAEARAMLEAEARARTEERARNEEKERARADEQARARAEAEREQLRALEAERERADEERRERAKAEARARAKVAAAARQAEADERARQEALDSAEPIFELICAALRPTPPLASYRPAPPESELDAMVDSLLAGLDTPRRFDDTLPGLVSPTDDPGRGMLASSRRPSPYRHRPRGAPTVYTPPSPADLRPLVDTASGIPAPN